MSEKELVSESTELPTGRHRRVITDALRTLHRLWRVSKYSSVYVSVLAMTEVGIAMILLGLPPNPAPVVIGLVTFAVYTNDRITDVETDAFSNPSKAQFIREYERFLYPLAAVAYGVAVTIAVTGGPVALALTLLPGTFWLFYASDHLNGLSRTVYRLKEILILNTAIVAFAWALTVTFLPFAFVSEGISPASAVLFAYFFLRVAILAEVSNISDRDGDDRIGVNTIPVVFGTTGTRRILYLVNLLTAALLGVAVLTGSLGSTLALPLFVAIGYSVLVTGLIGRWENATLLAHLVECEHFLTLLFVFVGMMVL